MATHEFQPDGSIIVTFQENGTSITLPATSDFQMDPSASDWHEYQVEANIPTIIESSSGIYLAREDVERALLQQSAPEWRDFTNPDIDPSTPLATNGSFTDTFGPGQVVHTISDNGTVIVNQTLPGHPFHPGIVVRTVVENADGSFSVLSYGLGNTNFEGAFGEYVADANFQAGMALFSQSGIIFEQARVNAAFRTGNECFGAGTPIDMWPLDPTLKPGPDGVYDQKRVRAGIWIKPIEQIKVGDYVISHDKKGNMVPGYVPRTMSNTVKVLLDFFGTRVTPGHVYYRPDSKKADKYETLIDILRDDGMIEHRDRVKLRAATNAPVGGPLDGFVWAVTQEHLEDGTIIEKDRGRIRLGTRFVVEGKDSLCVADVIEAKGGFVGEDELVRIGKGEPEPFVWEHGVMLPKPEDYVLISSGTSLEKIYGAGEWEGQRPHLPAPMVMDGGPVQSLSHTALSAMPRNEPLGINHGSAAVPAKPKRMLNRKQRKAMEAKQRKAAKSRKRILVS